MANGNSFTDYLSGNQWGSLSPAIGRMTLSQMPEAQYFDYVQQMPQPGARRSRYAMRHTEMFITNTKEKLVEP